MYDSVRHFEQLYASVPREFAFHASSREEWLAWREALLPRLCHALGLDKIESDLQGYQPTAEMSQSEDMGTHIREWWHLWVEPTVPLPFYLLRPKTQSGPLPLVLTPHGHNHPHIYVGIAHSEDEEKSRVFPYR